MDTNYKWRYRKIMKKKLIGILVCMLIIMSISRVLGSAEES
jgi:hypothetical protein